MASQRIVDEPQDADDEQGEFIVYCQDEEAARSEHRPHGVAAAALGGCPSSLQGLSLSLKGLPRNLQDGGNGEETSRTWATWTPRDGERPWAPMDREDDDNEVDDGEDIRHVPSYSGGRNTAVRETLVAARMALHAQNRALLDVREVLAASHDALGHASPASPASGSSAERSAVTSLASLAERARMFSSPGGCASASERPGSTPSAGSPGSFNPMKPVLETLSEDPQRGTTRAAVATPPVASTSMALFSEFACSSFEESTRLHPHAGATDSLPMWTAQPLSPPCSRTGGTAAEDDVGTMSLLVFHDAADKGGGDKNCRRLGHRRSGSRVKSFANNVLREGRRRLGTELPSEICAGDDIHQEDPWEQCEDIAEEDLVEWFLDYFRRRDARSPAEDLITQALAANPLPVGLKQRLESMVREPIYLLRDIRPFEGSLARSSASSSAVSPSCSPSVTPRTPSSVSALPWGSRESQRGDDNGGSAAVDVFPPDGRARHTSSRSAAKQPSSWAPFSLSSPRSEARLFFNSQSSLDVKAAFDDYAGVYEHRQVEGAEVSIDVDIMTIASSGPLPHNAVPGGPDWELEFVIRGVMDEVWTQLSEGRASKLIKLMRDTRRHLVRCQVRRILRSPFAPPPGSPRSCTDRSDRMSSYVPSPCSSSLAASPLHSTRDLLL